MCVHFVCVCVRVRVARVRVCARACVCVRAYDTFNIYSDKNVEINVISYIASYLQIPLPLVWLI